MSQVLTPGGKPIEQIFDERTKNWNGRLKLSGDGLLQGYLHEVRRYWSLLQGRQMPYVDYVDNAEANALACTHEGHQLIGIFAGLPLVLHDAFMRMLATPDLFPEIGDPSQEVAPEPLKPSLNALDVIYARMHESEARVVFIEPKDPHRAGYAAGLCLMALKFVVQHELGHHLNGHVGYTEATGRTFIEGAPIPESVALEQQTLEMDADAFAVKATVGTTITESDEDRRPLEERLFMWAVAVYTFFHVLYGDAPGTFGNTPGELSFAKRHPPPSTRLHDALEVAALRLVNAGLDVEWVREALVHAAGRCEQAYAAISGSSFDIDEYRKAIRLGQERRLLYAREWARLYPLLLPHARVGLVKPQATGGDADEGG